MRRTWRVSLIGRFFGFAFAGFGVFIIVVVVSNIVREGVDVNLVFGIVTGLIFAVTPFLLALRPSVTLTESELVVRNPLRTSRIDLDRISQIETGYSGITVSTQDGVRIGIWCVQKTNAASWAGVSTRADRIVEAIRHQADTRSKGRETTQQAKSSREVGEKP